MEAWWAHKPQVPVSKPGSDINRCRVATRVRVEGRDHGGLGLRSRGEGIGHGSEALHKKRMNMTLR